MDIYSIKVGHIEFSLKAGQCQKCGIVGLLIIVLYEEDEHNYKNGCGICLECLTKFYNYGKPSGSIWTQEQPIEPGYYWFYGKQPWAVPVPIPNHVFLVSILSSPFNTNSLFCKMNGKVYPIKEMPSDGYWMPATLPEPPQE